MTVITTPRACLFAGSYLGMIASQIFSGSILPALAFSPIPAEIHVYGAGHCLTVEQIIAAQHLSFPQTYAAITQRFGSAEAVSARYDWHCMPNSNQYLMFEYNDEGLAIGQLFSK